MRNRYKTLTSDRSKHEIMVVDHVENVLSDVEIAGHWYYTRKTERSENLGGIIIPDRLREDTNFVEIMAVGLECGKLDVLSKTDKWPTIRKKRWMRPGANEVYEPGDLLLCPEDCEWGMERSPFGFHEFRIDERIPIAVVKQGDEMKELRPIMDKVIIKPDPSKQVMDGDIQLPDIAQEDAQWGTIVAVGPGYRARNGERIQLRSKVGDRVVLPRYKGTNVKFEGEDFKVMVETDLIGGVKAENSIS